MKAAAVKLGAAALVLCSATLYAFLGGWEGSSERRVYADKLANGEPTVCRGLTRHVTRTPLVVGEVWTPEQCQREEHAAIIAVQTALLRCFRVQPPQSVFDAASSHAWNFGASATCGSAAMANFNRGDWAAGCRRLQVDNDGQPVWSFVRTGRLLPDGSPEFRFVRGLANRRAAERSLCESGLPLAEVAA